MHNAPEFTPSEIQGKHPSEMSRDELRAVISRQVAEEKQLAWDEACVKFPNKLDVKRETPPPSYALWQGLAPKEEKPESYTPKQIQFYMNRNELGDLEMLLNKSRGKYCFDKKAGAWWMFDGVWQPDAVSEFGREVMNLANHYDKAAKMQWKVVKDPKTIEEGKLTEAKALHKAFTSRAKSLRGSSRRSSVLRTAVVGMDSMAMSGEEWDKYPTLLATPNGYVDLETGKLYPPDPKMFIRQRSPYPYLGLQARDPFFDDMVEKLLCSSHDLMAYVQKVVGYASTGNLTHKEFYAAYGPMGNNGKSMFFNAICDVLGDYAATLRTELLLEGKGLSNEDPFWIALRNKRMAVASEAKKGSKFSMDRIKLVTGSDATVVRGLYEAPTEIRMPCKLFLHTNYIPRAHGGDRAFMDRLRIIPFMARFVSDLNAVDECKHIYMGRPMNEIDFRLKKAGSAILTYIVNGAKMYLNSMNLTPPEEVRNQTEEYIEDVDVIGEFIKIRCILGEKEKCQVKPFYNAFKAFCTNERAIPEKGIPAFGSFVSDLVRRDGITKKTTNYAFFHGICLRPEFRTEGL
ncbi:DNA primase family protein [Halodesulfovibrio aestuarii]|uniref:Phage/plasmid primase, P4 family n=2 Tax=Halodesulfovibrio aestuarii TaxID=126333 RepID=A0ABV4JXJ7_9BACT